MKRIVFLSCSFLAALFAAASCKSEVDDLKVSSSSGDVVIRASFEAPQSTRTALSGGAKVVWSAGDQFALLSAGSRDRFTLISGEKTDSGEFAGSVSGAAPFYALYPYSDECAVEGGVLKFKLPQEQKYAPSSFGNGASPAIATMADAASPAQFRNICGALEIYLCGSGKNISSIKVTDLSGAMLWGDCELALDGRQGTDEQTLTVTGGSNEITLTCESEIKLLSSTGKPFVIMVPPGTLSKGFTVKLFDKNGEALGFLSTQTSAVMARRSFIISMDKAKVPDNGERADTLARGYFKEVFQDGGCCVNSNTTLPACPYLNWEFDSMATSAGGSSTYPEADSIFQHTVICGDADDLNGALLYPDNEPRYRMIYVNGGTATNHGRTLSEEGRRNYVTFVNNGGSYVGTCAGAFMSSMTVGTPTKQKKEYLGIIPVGVSNTGYYGTTGMTVPEDSPLLDYYDFGGDLFVDSVKQAGGCYLAEKNSAPGVEVLMYYYIKESGQSFFDGQASVWAYKANKNKGRSIACGGHPEQITSGERRDMMAAMMRYACDGNGQPNSKCTLTNAQERKMDQLSTSSKPGYARIGDRQYHHFKISLPEGAKNITVKISGDGSHNLELSMRKGNWAWRTDSPYVLSQPGTDKTLKFDTLPGGDWYVSVYCSDLLKVTCAKNKFAYTGDKSVLNGVPYTIVASWE